MNVLSCAAMRFVCCSSAIAAVVLSSAGTSGAAVSRFPETMRPAVVALPVTRRDLSDLGEAAPSTPVDIAVTLAYRNKAELDRLVALQGNPRSPFFRHFLTPAQFASEFAPSTTDYARVATALAGAGFRVGPEAANRTVVDATGPASAAERFFGTEIHRVGQAGHGIRYANVRPATMPAALAADVTAVAGIDNVARARVQSVRDAKASSLKAPPYYPNTIAQVYHYPRQYGYKGAGHGIAIVIDDNPKNSDLAAFWNHAGIRRTGAIYRRVVDKYPSNAPTGEETLDVEWASGLAPGADVYIYFAPELTDKQIEDAYNATVVDDAVDVVSSSFGDCEPGDVPFARATDQIAEQGNAEGITYTASAGDEGSFCNGDVANPNVLSPASNPHFTAIGGTSLEIDATTGARSFETAWSATGYVNDDDSGGGGVSHVWPLPDYQTGVGGMAVTPEKSFAGRNIPDVSMVADPDTGLYVYFDGRAEDDGGTSISCVLFAALVANQNQEYGTRQGLVNETLYSSFTNGGVNPSGVYGPGTEFRDVVKGSIAGGYAAGPGYDQATGIGTVMNGNVI